MAKKTKVKQRTVTVLVKPVGKGPEVREIPDTLDAMQETVGGNIELLPFPGKIDVYFDEEGRYKNKPLNCLIWREKNILPPKGATPLPGGGFIWFGNPEDAPTGAGHFDILGDLFVTKHGDDGEMVSLSDDDVKTWTLKLTRG